MPARRTRADMTTGAGREAEEEKEAERERDREKEKGMRWTRVVEGKLRALKVHPGGCRSTDTDQITGFN